jgi:hypothetical protein
MYITINEDNVHVDLERNQYIDNGYGTYTTVTTKLKWNKKTKEIEEITIDDLTPTEWSESLQKIYAQCPYIQKHESCKTTLIEDLTSEYYSYYPHDGWHILNRIKRWWISRKIEKLETDDVPLCSDCILTQLIDLYAQQVNDGNW